MTRGENESFDIAMDCVDSILRTLIEEVQENLLKIGDTEPVNALHTAALAGKAVRQSNKLYVLTEVREGLKEAVYEDKARRLSLLVD